MYVEDCFCGHDKTRDTTTPHSAPFHSSMFFGIFLS